LPSSGIVNLGVYGGTAEASKSCPDGPVHFPDANLKAAVEQKLWVFDPTPVDMLALTEFIFPNMYGRDRAITNLSGLEYAVNAQELNLRHHKVNDLSAVSGLANLHTVKLLGNGMESIAPLSGLANLRTLDLEQNRIVDISALTGLANLDSVCLHRNFIIDISALSGLTHLTWLDVRANPMNEDAYTIHLPQIRANNPSMTLYYDPPFLGRLVISSTAGGSVIRPGEGEFAYGFYEVIVLEARADPGYKFAHWSGTYFTSDNPLLLTMDQDHDLRANFEPGP